MNTIIKIKDVYFEWSSIVDAPVTFGMSRQQMRHYLIQEYGRREAGATALRLERVDKYGTSCYPPKAVTDFIRSNRAGPDEGELTADEVYQAYGKRAPIRDGWCALEAEA